MQHFSIRRFNNLNEDVAKLIKQTSNHFRSEKIPPTRFHDFRFVRK